MNRVEKYIESNWEKCVRVRTEDEGDLIGLPYPYIVPSLEAFDELYYWDTYFTNKGLELADRCELAKNNVDDMLYLVERYGYMPNGSRTHYLGKSQPPFLSEMVKDVYENFKDEKWLEGAYKTLEKEYTFWMTERITPIGLNKYSIKEKDVDHYQGFLNRIQYVPEGEKDVIENHYLSECESGWDCNPRFDFEIFNFAPVDLNSLLYMLEKNMEYFSCILNNGRENEWREKAETRKSLMKKYLCTEDGLWLDYNFVTEKHSSVFSVASYYPMFAKMLEKEETVALIENMYRVEAEHGFVACGEHNVPGNYQWDAPNGWACLQYIMINSFDNYGYKEDALRVANKYTKLVEKVYDETGALWEKYNVVEGNINVTGESSDGKMPSMMGWSAGAYLYARKFLEENK